MDLWSRLFTSELLISVCGILMPLGVVIVGLNYAWKY